MPVSWFGTTIRQIERLRLLCLRFQGYCSYTTHGMTKDLHVHILHAGPGDPNSSHGLGSPVKSTYGKPQPKPGVPVWNTIPKAALGIPPSKD
jgi:hypothetical protein